MTVDDLLRNHDPEIGALTEMLRTLVRVTAPDASESVNAVWHSISFRHPYTGYFCGIFPQDKQVRLLFEFGVLLPDPDGLLTGNGRQVRYVEIAASDDVHVDALKRLILAALDLPRGRAAKLEMIRSGAMLGSEW